MAGSLLTVSSGLSKLESKWRVVSSFQSSINDDPFITPFHYLILKIEHIHAGLMCSVFHIYGGANTVLLDIPIFYLSCDRSCYQMGTEYQCLLWEHSRYRMSEITTLNIETV
jgi:hypothetical protein